VAKAQRHRGTKARDKEAFGNIALRIFKCRFPFLPLCVAVSLCLFYLPYSSPVFAQEGAQVSTAAVRSQQGENPLILTFTRDRLDSRVWLDYSISWDFSDLAGFRPGLKTLSESIVAIGSWDIFENTRIKYYGFRTNPWRIFIARERIKSAGPAVGGSQLTASGQNSPVYEKRLRLSFSPLVDDLKRGLDENLRSVLLRNSLKATGPQWGQTSTKNKKIFFQDVLSLDIWDLPLLDTTKEGLEYISQ
jgi:hypothetical protein